jgi:DNA polymerase-3 subunit delta'
MFEGIQGQTALTAMLSASIVKDQISHAYLFTGAEGMGKETFARAFASALVCTADADERPCGHCEACLSFARGTLKDFIHVMPAEGQKTIKIRQIRELITAIAAKTYDGGLRICLITDAHTMTPEAQNALLKSLEEPEANNVFILTAQNPEKVLPTIRSRCQVFALRPLDDETLRQVLEARGCPRGARMEAIIAQSAGLPGKAVDFFENQAAFAIKNEAFDVVYAILDANPCPIFDLAEKLGKSPSDSEAAADALIGAFSTALRAGLAAGEGEARGPLGALSPAFARDALDVMFTLTKNLGTNVNPRLQWEAAFLKLYELQEKQR